MPLTIKMKDLLMIFYGFEWREIVIVSVYLFPSFHRLISNLEDDWSLYHLCLWVRKVGLILNLIKLFQSQ